MRCMRSIIYDKYLRVVFGLSFFILFFAFIFGYVKLGNVSAPLIIHFDAYKGIDLLGDRASVIEILISATVMVLLNLFLADFLYRRERFLSYIFGFASLGLAALILIAIGVIVSVN